MRSAAEAQCLRARRGRVAVAVLAAVTWLVAPVAASAHPLGNFTVNRAVVVEIGAGVEIRYLVDMAEIPAFEAIRQLDTTDDGGVDASEVEAYAASACAAAMRALTVLIDSRPVVLGETDRPRLSFPPGAGGLETLRLECRFAAGTAVDPATEHRLEVRDTTADRRLGWREVTARATGGASITDSDVPDVSPSAELSAYPADTLGAPPDVRAVTLNFRTVESAAAAPVSARPGLGSRGTAVDPLAALVGGELSPAIVLLAMLSALGLGAVHALSPGHGKTLVAAYVLGAGGNARSAVQIGLSVAVSHTAGVFALGVVTLLASELFLPERVIGWLSLASAVVVTGLGIVLLARQWRVRRRRAGAPTHDADGHDHHHGHEHADGHGHDHVHPHAPRARGLTWRSALALGFAGGAVPSASALIVLLVAISSDRLAFGSLLIATFGIGMAIVLGGLGLLVARFGAAAGRAERGWLASQWVRRAGGWAPVAAGVVVLATGLAFAVTAAGQLG
jgi:nickel/cobalt exporter